MPDYQKAKIYKLWSPSKNLVYYGSTIQSLSQRLAGHKVYYKAYNNYKTKLYLTAYLILDCEDYKIELLEEYPCNNQQQLLKKEGEYIKNNECVNKQIAGRTKQEWRENNKEKLNQKNKEHYQKNKEHYKTLSKNYKEEHKAEIREKDKIYRENNLEKNKEYRKKYYENNLEKNKERHKKYRENNLEKVIEYRKKYNETKKQNNAIYKWLKMTGILA